MAQLWDELSALLRELRQNAPMPLREAERVTGWGRGNLSQIENGKARPTRAQVEWYDENFGGDGLLVSMYAEARGAHGPAPRETVDAGFVEGDGIEIVAAVAPLGELVKPGATVPVGWRLRNAGSVSWAGRQLRRVGPRAARGLIAGPDRVALADCRPGEELRVDFSVVMPGVGATLVACWEIVDRDRRPCFGGDAMLRVVLVGHEAV